MAGEAEELVDILDVNDEAPIIRWVNSLLFHAVKERASDIHIEPGEKEVVGPLPHRRRAATRSAHAARQFLPSIIARVKIMAGLNIAEKRLPQDGRIRRKIAGKDIDMRVATAPTAKGGERITIRLLDRENVLLDLADIGFGDDHLRADGRADPPAARHPAGHRPDRLGQDDHALRLPVARSTRPTSTSSPSRIRSSTSSTASRRCRCNEKIELTFATGLRSFLRHDPDVIMVGEIRDLPTAEIAIQASLTGHLVLSTIHTNDAAGAITRLVEMGVQPFLVASSLMGLLAQRLVRRLCPDCRELYQPDDEELASLGLDPGDFFAGRARRVRVQGRAAAAAGDALPGARGRLPELPGRRLPRPDRHLRAADDRRRRSASWPTRTPTPAPSRRPPSAKGMRTLRDDGAQKVLAGMTTAAEVLMMTAEDAE